MSSINAPHWHLLVNHLPVVGLMFTILLLLNALIRRSAELKRAALIAFILVGISAFLADTTGGPAARALRGSPGVNDADIRAHAQSADAALIPAELLGVLGIVGLILAMRKKEVTTITSDPRVWVRTHRSPPTWLMIVCLVISLADVFLMLRTANLGGAIRHPEINTQTAVPQTT